jgi:hypothetical protein
MSCSISLAFGKSTAVNLNSPLTPKTGQLPGKKVADDGLALVKLAKGAGQELFEDLSRDQDASGNIKLKDIGLFSSGKNRDLLRGGEHTTRTIMETRRRKHILDNVERS